MKLPRNSLEIEPDIAFDDSHSFEMTPPLLPSDDSSEGNEDSSDDPEQSLSVAIRGAYHQLPEVDTRLKNAKIKSKVNATTPSENSQYAFSEPENTGTREPVWKKRLRNKKADLTLPLYCSRPPKIPLKRTPPNRSLSPEGLEVAVKLGTISFDSSCRSPLEDIRESALGQASRSQLAKKRVSSLDRTASISRLSSGLTSRLSSTLSDLFRRVTEEDIFSIDTPNYPDSEENDRDSDQSSNESEGDGSSIVEQVELRRRRRRRRRRWHGWRGYDNAAGSGCVNLSSDDVALLTRQIWSDLSCATFFGDDRLSK